MNNNIKPYTAPESYEKLSECIPLSTPFTIMIDPGNVCNFKCKFCPTSDKELLKTVNRPDGIMEFDLFKKAVDDIKKFDKKLKKLFLYKDGEPLLNRNLGAMLKYAKDKDISQSLDLTTNGSLLNKEKAIEIIESGLDKIRISVESISDEKYKLITDTDVKYSTIKKNVEYLYKEKTKRKSKLHIHVKTLDINLSEEEKQKFIDDFSNISDSIYIYPLMGWSYSESKDFTLGIEVKDSESLHINYDRQVCPESFYNLAVNFNGLVSVCCVDWSWGTIVGDIKNESLIDIWNGEKLKDFRIKHLNGQRSKIKACANCKYMLELSFMSDIDDCANKILKLL
ncbi:radical SAM protein [Clostridium estertheticum]|uniref:Radical SAM protein n=1 Tax=Clostridium estertheticum TaxID=238834 RepID=A0A5N7J392_9CLOT|nr:radical SAM/SPASM domain-containing protein [Clostridium estertheticum]MPQ32550.1 radical SAM protein [Clostridium estertheticum]MPQ63209.1 radical SAM protein [Clostridium estertheticum]